MTEEGKFIIAAGGVVSRRTPRGREYLLVYRRRYDDWSLPKGKAKEGESPEQAALREVREETGYPVRLGGYLGEIRYQAKGMPKVVHWWTMEPVGPRGAVSDPQEIGSLMWLAAPDALALLAYPQEREILAKAAQFRR